VIVRGVDELVVPSAADGLGELGRRDDGEAAGTTRSAASPHNIFDWREVLDFQLAAEDLRLPPSLATRFAREDFGVSSTIYVQALVKALDVPEALMYAPTLVARLRRLREQRQALRVVDCLDPPTRPSPSSGRQRSLPFGRER
jgi:hypothetical protein